MVPELLQNTHQKCNNLFAMYFWFVICLPIRYKYNEKRDTSSFKYRDRIFLDVWIQNTFSRGRTQFIIFLCSLLIRAPPWRSGAFGAKLIRLPLQNLVLPDSPCIYIKPPSQKALCDYIETACVSVYLSFNTSPCGGTNGICMQQVKPCQHSHFSS